MRIKSKKEDRILVVDDTIANIQLLGELLQKEGFQLNVAQNGKQALAAVTAMPPDLILLDIMMPEMDGLETCRRLKANPETRDIPIIFLTARAEIDDIITGFKLGAVDYLTKPFKTEELFARINTRLDLRRSHKLIAQQNKELLEAAKLRDDVDLILRHDLKTPLNAILGYPQLILRKENLTEKGKQLVNNITDSGYRMLNMINLSLDLFKMERGVYQLKPVPVDILHIFDMIKKEVEGIVIGKFLEIKIESSGKPLKTEDDWIVLGEELLCYSLLANLIKNAVEASTEKACVTINLTKKEVIEISINNKGMVPVEIHDVFFEKYVTFGKSSGTGLGTYSAKLITETQQGQISMTTSESEGTTLTVQLPGV